MSTSEARRPWGVAVLCLVLGLVLGGAIATRDLLAGVLSFGIMALYAVILLVFRRFEPVALLGEEGGDERRRSIQLRAGYFTLNVLAIFCIGGFVLELARGGDGQPYALLGRIGHLGVPRRGRPGVWKGRLARGSLPDRLEHQDDDVRRRPAARRGEAAPAGRLRFEYSNTNYVLAGLVIEKLTGRPATEELRRRIFEPLGMRETSFPTWNPFIAGRHLNGYLRNASGAFEDYTVFSMSYAWTAGAVISTGADQTRFLRGLFDGRLLSKPMLAKMLDVGEFGYGLGIRPIRVDCVPGGIVWGHNGAVPGYHSAAYSTPDGKAQSAVAVNTWMLDPNRVR